MNARCIFRNMNAIVSTFVRILQQFEETGNVSVYTRLRIFVLHVQFNILRICLKHCVMNRYEKLQYVQIQQEYHSAKECMNIICLEVKEELDQPLL